MKKIVTSLVTIIMLLYVSAQNANVQGACGQDGGTCCVVVDPLTEQACDNPFSYCESATNTCQPNPNCGYLNQQCCDTVVPRQEVFCHTNLYCSSINVATCQDATACGRAGQPCCQPSGFTRQYKECIGSLQCRAGTCSNGVTVGLTAAANPIASGTATTLTWTVSGATSCTAFSSPQTATWTGGKSKTGGTESTGNLNKDTTFTLSCTDGASTSSASVTVQVTTSPLTINFSASPSKIVAGGTSTLTWSVQNAVGTTCNASGGWNGSKSFSGSESVKPTSTTQYLLECQGATGFQTKSVTVTVDGLVNPANPTTCTIGGKTGINTAIGCLPISDFNQLGGTLVSIAIGIAGGIAFVMIAYSAFIMTNSTGDPKRIQSAQDLFGAAVGGLILLIFSTFILRIIGVNIFKLPFF